MTWSTDLPARGDIVRVKVKFYYHYGIYISEKEVVAFGAPDNADADSNVIEVGVTDIDTFCAGGFVERGICTREERRARRTPDETVSRALSRVGERGYNILHNNCEHFANECAFGEHSSGFVESVREGVSRRLNKHN